MRKGGSFDDKRNGFRAPDVDERETEVTYDVQVRNRGEASDTFKIQVLKTGMTKPAGVDQDTWDAIVTSGQFSDKPDWVILSKKVTGSKI